MNSHLIAATIPNNNSYMEKLRPIEATEFLSHKATKVRRV
jgi:hypothetical protein